MRRSGFYALQPERHTWSWTPRALAQDVARHAEALALEPEVSAEVAARRPEHVAMTRYTAALIARAQPEATLQQPASWERAVPKQAL